MEIEPGSPQPQESPFARSVLVLRTRAQRRRRALLLGGTLGMLALAGATALLLSVSGWGPSTDDADDSRGAVGRLVIPEKSADLSVILETEVMPLSPADARAINEERPVDVAEVVPASPFRVVGGQDVATQFDAAVKCLTQAIYYEAASEPEDGQRAVAQVVINRVKHPAFPNTICGVVYQGSQRVTGCQFTFTCDGSLARVPLPSLYRRAERLAREAMAGRVARQVGNSTNYHADYVVPYWASSLDKLAQIGRHIFYGLRGAVGYRSAFRMRYDIAHEIAPGPAPLSLPTAPAMAIPDPLAALPGTLTMPGQSQLAEDAVSGSLIPGAAAVPVDGSTPSSLRADHDRGELLNPGAPLLSDEKAGAPSPGVPR